MSVGASLLAAGSLSLDRSRFGSGSMGGWLYAGGPDGAMTLLATIAGSTITVAGVAFSITIAALSQASSQFGPRLLRNFMRDTGNQVVLGTFVATFVYCILILRTIHPEVDAGGPFVPHFSVTMSVVLAAMSISMLIYFIHHISASLQAPAVVAVSAGDLKQVIERLPEDLTGDAVLIGEKRARELLPATFETQAIAVCSDKDGYIQAVDLLDLVALAKERDLLIHLAYRAGDHVMEGVALAHVWPQARCDERTRTQINAGFLVGRHSTPEQDVEYAIRQMVEIAVRALSPAVNDPFTAINCIDALGSAVCRIARRGLPGPYQFDDVGKLRLVAPVPTFEGVVDAAFNQIRQYGRDSVAVSIRLLEVLAECAKQMTTPEQKHALLRHVEMVYCESEQRTIGKYDRMAIERRHAAAMTALGSDLATCGRRPQVD